MYYDIIDLMLDMYDIDNICPSKNEDIIHFGIACTRNKVKLVKAFIDRGMNVNVRMEFSKDYLNVTPLHLGVLYQSVKVVKLLLNSGADFSLKDTEQSTPLHCAYNYATDTENNYKIIHLILSAHAAKFSNPTNNENVSHFHIACMKSDPTIVKIFLNNGVDINSCDNKSNTPLHMAIYNKQNGKDIVQLLLNKNAKINATNGYGQTPLHKAALLKSNEIIKLLIDHGADVSLKDKSGYTPFLEIYSRDNIDGLKILLRYIPDLNFTDDLLQNNFDSLSYRLNPNKILVMHIEKMRLIGFQMKKNNDYYNKIKANVLKDRYNAKQIEEFKIQCKKELERMQGSNITNYTTLYKILVKNSWDVPNQNNDFKRLINSEESELEYPIYGFLFKLLMKKAEEKYDLQENTLTQASLPATCYKNIFGNLSNNSLAYLIETTNNK